MTEKPGATGRQPPGSPDHRKGTGSLRDRATRTGRAIGRGTVAGVRLAGRGGRAGAQRARAYTASAGAGETGLARLIELHFVNLMGDAALTVSLAGTIFAIPTDEARGQVAQFLALTMAPFVLLAPFIGPLLDRFRHGRRWAIGTTLALRAFLCWVLAGAVAEHSAWLFPAALGCLVASKAYGVTRSSAVPRLLPAGFSLVNANSRSALAGVAGMAIGGGLAGAAARVGPEWSLRLAFLIYVVATVMAIRLPARVDSSAGEHDIADTVPLHLPRTADLEPRGGFLRRARARVSALPPTVLAALCAAVGARLLTGFLTLFMAFLMREHPIPGHNGTLVLGLVVGAAGAGNALGTVVGNALRRRRPDVIVAVALLAEVLAALAAAVFYSLGTLLALGLCAGLTGQLIKLSSDAVVQRDIEESVRTRVFAWSETVLQTAWVVGGAIGIALPLVPQLGFGVVSGLLVLVLAATVRIRLSTRRARVGGAWDGGGPHRPGGMP
ncbi:MAG TPA: MFS transporter [Pedococcus sp.]|nr:MFS transporter [Pedococcus sp.]